MAEGEFRREEPHQESLHSLRLNVFSAPGHKRAQPAVHLRTSRAGG